MRTLRRPLAVLLAIALTSCSQTPVALPSESPSATPSPQRVTPRPATPTPTPSPTPTPTAAPTPEPPPPTTPRPRPTTRHAGLRILPYYAEIRELFPILPVGVEIMFDEPAGTEGNAFFHGLNAAGEPRFAVREDFVIDKGTAAHEIGHAYQKVLERSRPVHIDVLTPYWEFRGFPGTWQQAMLESQQQGSYSAQWIWSPIESWAEAFRAAVMLETAEKTLDYGKPIDPMAAREFFQSLQPSQSGN